MLEPRRAVRSMRPYSPPTGNRRGKARLDFNENTVGCSPKVAAFLRRAVDEDSLATYPGYGDVYPQLAKHFAVEQGELALTNGTDEAIQLLIQTFVEAGDQVLVPSPSYAMYRFYAEVAGADVVEVPVIASEPWLTAGVDPGAERLLDAITPSTKAIFIANPNNPTGAVYSRGFLRQVLERAPRASVLVDEAYFDFYGESMLPFLHKYPNIFVSRTFSKAYGMAALRVGCLIGRTENIASVRKCQSPYSVNMLAALAAAEAVRDAEYLRAYVEQALQGRKLIESGLAELGYSYLPSRANFVLFNSGSRAAAILHACGDADIRIRDRRHELPGALRVTAGTPSQIEQFIAVLEALA